MNKKEKLAAVQARVMPGFTGAALTFGNRKLPKSHLILNLCSATLCPSAHLGMCAVRNICYALREERIYKSYYEKNTFLGEWFKTASDDDIFDLIKAYAESAPKTVKVTHVRLNEAGDFRDQAQVDQMSRVAKRLKNELGIIVYGWSARKDLDFSNVEFILNGSSGDVTGAQRVFKAVSHEEFKALPKTAITYGGSRGLSCRECHVCCQDKFHGTV